MGFFLWHSVSDIQALIAIISHSVLIEEAQIFARTLGGNTIALFFLARYVKQDSVHSALCGRIHIRKEKNSIATSAANNFGVGV